MEKRGICLPVGRERQWLCTCPRVETVNTGPFRLVKLQGLVNDPSSQAGPRFLRKPLAHGEMGCVCSCRYSRTWLASVGFLGLTTVTL